MSPRPPRELPSWAREAVDRVLHDLQHPAPIALRLASVGEDCEAEMLWVEEAGVRGGTGFPLTVEERGEDLVVTLADWFQDQVFLESRGAWGESRPACPGHEHPAVAELVRGQAVWICPVDERPIARIGELPLTPGA